MSKNVGIQKLYKSRLFDKNYLRNFDIVLNLFYKKILTKIKNVQILIYKIHSPMGYIFSHHLF